MIAGSPAVPPWIFGSWPASAGVIRTPSGGRLESSAADRIEDDVDAAAPRDLADLVVDICMPVVDGMVHAERAKRVVLER